MEKNVLKTDFLSPQRTLFHIISFTTHWNESGSLSEYMKFIYLYLLKTSYGILRILNFDWLTRYGIWAHIPLTTNMLRVRVFLAIIVAEFLGISLGF